MTKEELHTFLFADISGYSTLTELEGDEAAAEIAIRFADAVSRIAAEYGAEIVKTMGDGLMLHCSSAASAIELGLRLHEEWQLPRLHAGIHTGPAIARAGDWWGATVNVAARVCAAAEAGQLLVTDAARRAAGGKADALLSQLGPLQLKNITNLVEVYANHAPGQVNPTPVAGQRTLAA